MNYEKTFHKLKKHVQHHNPSIHLKIMRHDPFIIGFFDTEKGIFFDRKIGTITLLSVEGQDNNYHEEGFRYYNDLLSYINRELQSEHFHITKRVA